jgi:hypothetical protein
VTRGSKIHDEVSAHFRRCKQCRAVDPETERIKTPDRRTVFAATLAAMCSEGRGIYKAYLSWLAEPEL